MFSILPVVKAESDVERGIKKCIAKESKSIENWEAAIDSVIEKNPDGSFKFKEELIEENVGVFASEIITFLATNIGSPRAYGFESKMNELLEHFTSPENLCDPQKRFIIFYMLKYIEHIYGLPQNKGDADDMALLYGRLIGIIEEMNRRVISNVLENADIPDAKRNVLKRILALIQMSVDKYRYTGKEDSIYAHALPLMVGARGSQKMHDKGFSNASFSSKFEYPTSALAHCESVVIQLPYSMEFNEFISLIGANDPAVGMYPRQSTHSTKIDPETGAVVESKGMRHGIMSTLTSLASQTVSGMDSLLSYVGTSMEPVRRTYWAQNISSLMSQADYQYGIDIPINTYNLSDKKSARGHILISFSKYEGRSVALVKLEDCGPGETSVTGHGHGASGKSNYISATSHIRLLNQYENRLALVCDLSSADNEELSRKMSSVVEGCKSDELTSPRDEFIHKWGEIEHCSRGIPGVQFYRCERLWGGPLFTNYGYIIDDQDAFKTWCGENGLNDDEFKAIMASNNTWLYSSRSWTREDIFSLLLPDKFLRQLMQQQERFAAGDKSAAVINKTDVKYGATKIIDDADKK